MSYVKKRQQNLLDGQKHNELALEEYDEKHVFVRLIKQDTKDYWDENFYDLNAIWKKKGWIINRSNLEKLKVIMFSNMEDDSEDNMSDDEKGNSKNNSSHEDCDCSDCEDESSSTDDELVQKALSRRLMSESTQKEIEVDNVEDSELEDVISVCRRFRFLYRELRSLKQRVADLERR